MPSTLNKLSKNRIKISVTIPAEQMANFFEEEYERLAQTVTLPGFRAGKAPRVMTIEALGHARLSQNAINRALDHGYREALLEHKHFPVTEPSVSATNYPPFGEDKTQNEFTFEIEFDILADAKIGDYKKIKVGKTDPEKLKVSDEEIKKVVSYLARQQAKLNPVSRATKNGDWAQVSFKGSLKGVWKDKLTSTSMPVVLGETQLIPGFAENIVGSKKNETKKFKVKFPKDFPDREFAGVEVDFEVKIEEVKEIELPKIDDEFAKKFGNETVSKMKEAIHRSLEGEKKARATQIQRGQIGEQIIKMTKVEIPQSLIEKERERLKGALGKDLTSRGQTLEQYIQNVKITEEKLDAELKEQAKRNITLGVGLGEIAKAQGIMLGTPEATDKVFDRIVELNSNK